MLKSVSRGEGEGNKTLWLIAFVDVLFLPVLLYSFLGGRDQTSMVDQLLSITGTQAAGMLLFVVALGTRIRAKTRPFGLPLHKWSGLALIGLIIAHVLLALATNPENYMLLMFWDAPPRATAATAAFICWICVALLGEYRKRSGLDVKIWTRFHIGLAWLGAIFAFAHIFWIDKLVNEGVWLLLFVGMAVTAFYLWLTRAKRVSKSTEGAVPKIVRWAVVFSTLLAVAVSILSWRVPDALTIGYTQNELGPVGPADRDMLYKVRQAGLWEMPVGMEASQRATSPRLREVGELIHSEHAELDRIVNEAAAKLNVPLPDEPSPDQKVWIANISASTTPNEYDYNAVFYMRQAHGKILPVLAQVRAGTRNQVIRDVASESIEYVHRHIGYLESTGLVNFASLPESPTPSPYQQPVEASYFDSHEIRTLVISSIVVVVLCALFTFIILGMLRSISNKKAQSPSPRPRAKHRRTK